MIEKFKVGKLNVDVNISNRIAVFMGSSGGRGTTFLFRLLREKAVSEGKKTIFVDSLSMRTEDGSDIDFDCDIVFLDNADLYMSESLFDRIAQGRASVLVNVKSVKYVLRNGNIGYYNVYYENDRIWTKRRSMVGD